MMKHAPAAPASSNAPFQQYPIDVSWGLAVAERYTCLPDITYTTAGNCALKLDIYKPLIERDAVRPTLIYFHGGGWMGEYAKGVGLLQLLPFMQLGWTLVNVDYRPSNVCPAPAAVEDCLCAFRWVGRHAHLHNIDTRQLVLMGQSAGGHLALTTGMIPMSASGLGAPGDFPDMFYPPFGERDRSDSLRPAAIVNWFGISDVSSLIEGCDTRPWAVKWIGHHSDRIALAKAVSPLSYVRPDLPPIFTVHGTGDTCVPYDQSVRLHQALAAVGVPNTLIPLHGANHGSFGVDTLRIVYPQLFEFLRSACITVTPESE